MNKYLRTVHDIETKSIEARIDVYSVLEAFQVTCPAIQHAVKKLLCSGMRGHKDRQTDLQEAKQAIQRACELDRIRAAKQKKTDEVIQHGTTKSYYERKRAREEAIRQAEEQIEQLSNQQKGD
jgi:hypothetical protein